MSYVQKISATATTTSGSCTMYLPPRSGEVGYVAAQHSAQDTITGLISVIHYAKVDFANGVDFAITSEATGETIWTESNVNATASRAPRQATHSTLGVAATYDGTRAVLDGIYLSNDRLKIAITSASGTQTGTFTVVVA